MTQLNMPGYINAKDTEKTQEKITKKCHTITCLNVAPNGVGLNDSI